MLCDLLNTWEKIISFFLLFFDQKLKLYEIMICSFCVPMKNNLYHFNLDKSNGITYHARLASTMKRILASPLNIRIAIWGRKIFTFKFLLDDLM